MGKILCTVIYGHPGEQRSWPLDPPVTDTTTIFLAYMAMAGGPRLGGQLKVGGVSEGASRGALLVLPMAQPNQAPPGAPASRAVMGQQPEGIMSFKENVLGVQEAE